jgi:phage tail sheath protein FI
MPEYLAPGVYVEERSFRQKTIEGVSTSTAGFVGPTRFGSVAGEPELLTSFFDFERIYGGIEPLDHGAGEVPNDVAHAVRGFFENGGSRLYVVRTYRPPGEEDDGCARHAIGSAATDDPPGLLVRGRHPGAAGNVPVTFSVQAGNDILGRDAPTDVPVLRGATAFDTVLVVESDEPALYWLEDVLDPATGQPTFRLRRPTEEPDAARLAVALGDATVHVLTVTVTSGALGRFGDEQTWAALNPDPRHRRSSLLVELAAEPTRRATELYVPIVLETDPGASLPGELTDGVTVLEALLEDVLRDSSPAGGTAADLVRDFLVPATGSTPTVPRPLQVQVVLANGSDGGSPGVAEYEGDEDDKTGLKVLEDLENISIVAVPGSTRGGLSVSRASEVASIQQLVIAHCERMRYRMAVLDSPDQALVGQVLEYRAKMDTTRAALYYPWITIVDPLTSQEMSTPPSGFVCGIYARNDVERGVHKSPANEVVRLAIGFEQLLNKAQQDVLNPEGVDCLRYFEGRGLRVWGARTMTSDPEWKYVALRRFFIFLERSIDKGTQWAVFEPNGEVLWNQVRRTVEDFLFTEWASGHLMGETPEEAYFVTCDRTTMTQNDFDNGRLICLVGVAPLSPAEFVIFRIGQKTLESRG